MRIVELMTSYIPFRLLLVVCLLLLSALPGSTAGQTPEQFALVPLELVLLECAPGFTGPGGDNCTACEAGKYKNESGSQPCSLCPPDTFNPSSGGESEAVCEACPSNSSGPAGSVNVSACRCNVEFEGADGGPCKACRPGYYKPFVGDVRCVGPVGSGSAGFVDGSATTAQFNQPMGLAVVELGAGEMGVAISEVGNHAVRLLAVSGLMVSTLAGGGFAGFRDGVGSEALFNHPSGLAALGPDYLVVADGFNHRIRGLRLSSRAVETLAGTGRPGFLDGPAASAQLNFPAAVAAVPGSASVVVVADMYNRAVRSLDLAAGTLATLSATAALEPLYPFGVAVALGGEVLVSDHLRSQLRQLNASGHLVPLAGSGARACADGLLAQASLAFPRHIALSPDGLVYVADTDNGRVRVVDVAGLEVRTLLAPGLISPAGVVLLPNMSKAVVADTQHHQVRSVWTNVVAASCHAGAGAG